MAVFYYGNHLKKDRFHNYAKSPKPIKKVSKMEVNKIEPYHTLRKEPTSDKANWHEKSFLYIYHPHHRENQPYLAKTMRYTSNIPAIRPVSTCIQNWFTCHLPIKHPCRKVNRTVYFHPWKPQTLARVSEGCLLKGPKKIENIKFFFLIITFYHSFGRIRMAHPRVPIWVWVKTLAHCSSHQITGMDVYPQTQIWPNIAFHLFQPISKHIKSIIILNIQINAISRYIKMKLALSIYIP